MNEIMQTQLTVWRGSLLAEWTHIKCTLISELKASHHDEWATRIAQCDHDQLVELINTLALPVAKQAAIDLKRIDAALCQMDLGLYGLCADCEEPLTPSQLAQGLTTQRCLDCETRYRKGFHAHEL